MSLHILATTCHDFAVAPQLELEITNSTHPHHVFHHFQTNNPTVLYNVLNSSLKLVFCFQVTLLDFKAQTMKFSDLVVRSVAEPGVKCC